MGTSKAAVQEWGKCCAAVAQGAAGKAGMQAGLQNKAGNAG